MVGHVIFGVLVSLAWFFVVNLAVTFALLLTFPSVRRLVARGSSPLVPLLFRLAPFLAAAAAIIAIVIPAYAALEPRQLDERAGWISIVLASGGLALLLGGLGRGLRAVRRTDVAVEAYGASATELPAPTPAVRAFAVPTSRPVMMLAGIRRPSLYVAHAVLDALTPDELRVAVTHELAHHRAADNAKRLVVACAPDLFGGTSAARELVREWHARAEVAADRAAAAGKPSNAVHLAAALVKVARLAAGAPAPELDCATLHGGAPIGHRVRRLLEEQLQPSPAAERRSRTCVIAALTMVVVIVAASDAHRIAHHLTELLVRLP